MEKVVISKTDPAQQELFKDLVQKQMNEAIEEVQQNVPNGPLQFLQSRHKNREELYVLDTIPAGIGKRPVKYICRSHGPNRAARRAARFKKKR